MGGEVGGAIAASGHFQTNLGAHGAGGGGAPGPIAGRALAQPRPCTPGRPRAARGRAPSERAASGAGSAEEHPGGRGPGVGSRDGKCGSPAPAPHLRAAVAAGSRPRPREVPAAGARSGWPGGAPRAAAAAGGRGGVGAGGRGAGGRAGSPSV